MGDVISARLQGLKGASSEYLSILELEQASDIRHHAEEEEEESPGGEKLAFGLLSPHTTSLL